MSQIFIPASAESGVVDSVSGTAPIQVNGVSGTPETGAVIVSVTDATTSSLGVASFNSSNFSVTGGAVSLTGITQYDVLSGGATNKINNIAPSATSGVPLISQGSSSQAVFGTAVVAGGGTGDTSFTAYAPVCGGTTTTGALQSASTGMSNSGYVLTSTGGSSLPTWQASGGGGGGITTIDGDSGSVTGSTVTIYANQSAKNSGATVEFVNSGTTSTLNVTDSSFNTYIGNNCGVNLSGTYNTALGAYSMSAITGSDNTALGFSACRNMTSGAYNVAVGFEALYSETTGQSNIAIGYTTMVYSSGASNNIAMGNNTLAATTGSSNVALGFTNMQTATSASYEVAIGFQCLQLETTGSYNVAIGYRVMLNSAGSQYNVGLGNDTLYNITGSNNIALGNLAMQSETTGTNNTAIGTAALQNSTGATYNVAIGNAAMGFTNGPSGAHNIAIGTEALYNVTSASYNVAIGYQAGLEYTSSESSNIVIGNEGTTSESHVIRIGTQGSSTGEQNTCYIAGITGATVTGAAVLCSTSGQLGTIASSGRYKENISDMPDEVSVLNLRPVQFSYKKDKLHARQFGLIAEEVENSFPYLCLYNDEGQPESVKYHELPVFLLREIQRLNKRIEKLESR